MVVRLETEVEKMATFQDKYAVKLHKGELPRKRMGIVAD
jgi:hypothetical protein